MNTVSLLAIFAENKTGELARVTGLLAQAHINIRWVTIAGAEKFGVMKLLVNDFDIAFHQLKHNGVPVSRVDVVAIEVDDKPGGLHAVARCLAENQINVENASGFVSHGRAVLLIEASDPARAAKLLSDKGLRVLDTQATLSLGC